MPLATEPLRERILAMMAERLATIGAGERYWTTPKVTRSLREIDQYPESDLRQGVLGVMRSEGSTLTLLPGVHVDDAGRVKYRHLVTAAVWGYVAEDADMTLPGAVLAGTRLERLWRDHVTCLLADDELGGLVIDLSPDAGPLRTDRGGIEPRAWFEQRWVATADEPFMVA